MSQITIIIILPSLFHQQALYSHNSLNLLFLVVNGTAARC